MKIVFAAYSSNA